MYTRLFGSIEYVVKFPIVLVSYVKHLPRHVRDISLSGFRTIPENPGNSELLEEESSLSPCLTPKRGC